MCHYSLSSQGLLYGEGDEKEGERGRKPLKTCDSLDERGQKTKQNILK